MRKNLRLSFYLGMLCVLIIASFSLAGCGEKAQPTGTEGKTQQNSGSAAGGASSGSMEFWAASPSGAWYPLAAAITDHLKSTLPNTSVSIMPGGSIANVKAVNEKTLSIGFANGAGVYDGYRGNSPFDKANTNIRQIINLLPQYSTLMVNADAGIDKVEDLKGKKINVYERGLTNDTVTQLILKSKGLSYSDMAKVEYLAFADAAEAFKDGHTDGLMGATMPYPHSTMIDIANSKKIKMLSLDDQTIDFVIKQNPGLSRITFTPDKYKHNTPVNGLTTPVALITNASMTDDVVYTITKTIVDNLKALKEASPSMAGTTLDYMGINIGIPFHPGAEKYLKEAGILK